jgi:hypothetical protein
MLTFKNDRAPERVTFDIPRVGDAEPFEGIRCPHCSWRPSPSNTWSCSWLGTPEPYFESCGAVWNTFATRGRCPGCAHQWTWTSCLNCGQWSLHDDWYEDGGLP